MAQGDVVVFDQFLVDSMEQIHNMEADLIKVALVDGTIVPTDATLDPAYGAGGNINFATDECANGGNYVTGGATCANPAVTLNAGAAEIDFDDPATWAQHTLNPTDARYGIIYNDTSTGKKCVAYVDLGSTFDMTTGDLTITWGNPFATLDQV